MLQALLPHMQRRFISKHLKQRKRIESVLSEKAAAPAWQTSCTSDCLPHRRPLAKHGVAARRSTPRAGKDGGGCLEHAAMAASKAGGGHSKAAGAAVEGRQPFDAHSFIFEEAGAGAGTSSSTLGGAWIGMFDAL